MSVQVTQGGIATLDATTDAEQTPVSSVAPRGVQIDVRELSRRVRIRRRGVVTLLDGASFTLTAGQLVAIVGPSGAG